MSCAPDLLAWAVAGGAGWALVMLVTGWLFARAEARRSRLAGRKAAR